MLVAPRETSSCLPTHAFQHTASRAYSPLILVAMAHFHRKPWSQGSHSRALITTEVASQVLYGMDYLSSERDRQHAFLRAAVLDHLRRAPAALLVIEEYDKLDCPTRAMLRQLIGSSRASNTSMARCPRIGPHPSHSVPCQYHTPHVGDMNLGSYDWGVPQQMPSN